MKKNIFSYLFISLLLFSEQNFAQNIDSLWSVYKNEKNQDTIRLQAFNDIAWSLLYTNPDSAYLLGHEELEKAKKLKLKKWESQAYNTIGASYQVKGNYLKAIDFYQQSLKIREKLRDNRGVSSSLANIGSIYINIGEFEKALYYQLKSLKIFQQIDNKEGMASSLNNIGVIYKNLSDYPKALEYNQRSLKLYEEIGDKQGIAASYDNIGNIYSSMEDLTKALEFQLKSFDIDQEIGDKSGVSTILSVIAKTYLKQKKYPLALENAIKGKKLAVEIQDISAEKEATSVLYEIYKEMGNKSLALENYERFVSLRDSIFKEDNQRAITSKALEYEFEKKAAADSVKHDEEKRVKDALIMAKTAQIEQDKTQKWALFGGLLLLLVSGGIMYNRFRIIRKQKEIIEIKNKETEEQKAIIEEKQKEILASISYAKRLQEAILPPQSLIKQFLPESFIFYKPKDIVAGDFYWMEVVNLKNGELSEEKKNNIKSKLKISELQTPDSQLILFAAADCTGHGVPGAMVSVVCSNALNRTVKEFGIIEPGKILDKVRELVIETFEKSESEVNDGMDISLCAYNRKTNELKWAGANNPLWIVRKNEFMEFKPNKQSIGKIDSELISYQTHSVQLQKNDSLYIFSDGYADQFGGVKGKKFNYKNLLELILKCASLPLEKQELEIHNNLNKWKGNLEQVDDILVIGIKV